jgi:serine/threonine protein phosphatase PrpC
MRLDSFACTTAGRRPDNQDRVEARPELGLFVLADGMGGYEGGAIASQLAVTTIVSLVARGAADNVAWPYPADPRVSSGENEVAIATRLAGERIGAERRGPLAHMGSTVVVLRLDGTRAVVGHVGDSRVYRWRAGRLDALTVDHSLWAELVASGTDPAGWDDFPYKNVVTRALGTPTSAPDVRTLEVAAGDVYLLCSDGLTEGLSAARLAALLGQGGPAEVTCRTLVDEAFAAGSRDNISAIVVRVEP